LAEKKVGSGKKERGLIINQPSKEQMNRYNPREIEAGMSERLLRS